MKEYQSSEVSGLLNPDEEFYVGQFGSFFTIKVQPDFYNLSKLEKIKKWQEMSSAIVWSLMMFDDIAFRNPIIDEKQE